MNRTRLLPRRAAALLGLIFLAPAVSFADPVPPPAAPFVRPPAPGTQWTVTLKYPPETKSGTTNGANPTPTPAKGSRPARVQYQCGTNATVVRIVDESGAIFSEGYVVATHVFKLTSTGNALAQQSDDGNYASPFFVHGYLGTEWIGTDTYLGTDTVGKDLCYKYRKAPLVVKENEAGFSHPELFAWVRVKDNLPVAVAIGPVSYVFSDISPSPGEPTLPPAIQKLIEQASKENRALEAMRRMQR